MSYVFALERIFYQDQCILDSQNFVLHKKKWTGLIGKSGEGKTTLLKVLVGILPGLKKTHPLPSISYMPQFDLLLPWKTVLENVTLGADLRKQSPNLKMAKEFLNEADLSSYENSYPYELSVGMRQRVALVRTLMEETEIVLMDEPFSAIDIPTRHQLYQFAKKILRNKTILFVSHDLNEVSALANYVVILKGRPAQCQFIDHFNNTSDYSLSSKHNISWQHIAPLWHALYEQN